MGLKKSIQQLLLLILFLVPLIGPVGNLGYEMAKVVSFLFLTSIAGLAWIYYTLKHPLKDHLSFKNPLILSSTIFLLALLITSLTGINPKTSFLGQFPYFQGLIFYAYLYFFSLLVSSMKLELKSLALVLSLSSAIVSVLAIKDFILQNLLEYDVPNYAGRVVSTFGQPNFYAGFLLINLPFIYYLIKRSNNPLGLWQILLAVSTIMAIIISLSRTSIFVLLLFLFALFLLKLKFVLRLILIICVLAIFLQSALISYSTSSGIIYKELIEPFQGNWLSTNSPEKRVFVWQTAWQIILKRPILGYGLENIEQSYSDYFKQFKPETMALPPAYFVMKDLVVDRAHSYLLDLLTFSGILGTLTWISLVYLVFKNTKSKILLSSLVLYIVWVQFQNQSVVNLIQFWLLAGLASDDSNY